MLDHCAPALTVTDLDGVEDSLGLTLPRDVREHYLRWNGGTPRATCWVVDDEVVVDVAAFLPVRYGDGTRYGTLEDTYAAHVAEGLLPVGLVPFASDWGGAAVCLDVATEDVVLKVFTLEGAPVTPLVNGFGNFVAGLVPAED